jgi:hypothetical protein
MKQVLVVLALLALASGARGQSVENVSFEQTDDDRVVVTYDLLASPADPFVARTEIFYAVELVVSADGGATFPMRPVSVTGDVGEGVAPGAGKRIVWDALADVSRLVGQSYVVKVVATPLRPRIAIQGSRQGDHHGKRGDHHAYGDGHLPRPTAPRRDPEPPPTSRVTLEGVVLHTVRAWESLSSLSRLYGTSMRAIQEANALGPRSRIEVGTVLKIPVSQPPGASSGDRD